MKPTYVVAMMFVVVTAGAAAQPLDGSRDCMREDDGRPICISVASRSHHVVTENPFSRNPRVTSVPSPQLAENSLHLSADLEAGSPTSTNLNAEDLYAIASRSIVVIGVVGKRNDEDGFVGQGSGVVVKPGRVVTNCHVLKGAQAAGVFYQGELYDGVSVVDVNLSRDLCLLNAVGLPAPPIRLGTASTLRIGQPVFAIGAPQGLDLGFDLSLSAGLVSALRRRQDEYFPMIQTSAPISEGSSGGALLAADGSLIGITTMVHREGQNLNFAVPVDWIRDFSAAR